jgi:hypothetical protein
LRGLFHRQNSCDDCCNSCYSGCNTGCGGAVYGAPGGMVAPKAGEPIQAPKEAPKQMPAGDKTKTSSLISPAPRLEPAPAPRITVGSGSVNNSPF